jgi:cyclopropane fatty-acyl-phospholipid synthase-like methyltransferase
MAIMNSNINSKIGYSYEDWEHHYDEKDVRWDLDEVAPPFIHLWKEKIISPCSAIVPGCGAGHEVLFLAKKGFRVTAVDYTRGATDLIKKNLHKNNLMGEVLQQDFFDFEEKYNESFDLLLEHAFFCAINPDKRQRYAEIAGKLIKPGGLIIALFYETSESGGPPFNTQEKDIKKYFSENFLIESLSKTPHSAEQRKGKEWLAILKRK